MARKRSNLAVAADVGTVQEVLRIAEAAGPHIAVLKTHVDIFDEWNSGIAAQLRKLAEEHGRAAICWWRPFISCLLMPGMESGGMHGRQGLKGQSGCSIGASRYSCDASKAWQAAVIAGVQHMCPSVSPVRL